MLVKVAVSVEFVQTLCGPFVHHHHMENLDVEPFRVSDSVFVQSIG